MKRNEILRNLGLAAMFFGGFLGAQSIWWGWITACPGHGPEWPWCCQLQHRSNNNDTQDKE